MYLSSPLTELTNDPADDQLAHSLTPHQDRLDAISALSPDSDYVVPDSEPWYHHLISLGVENIAERTVSARVSLHSVRDSV
jgi:hypothetical protein